ncbi:DUF1992 domain-containing protein [Buttiauxella sp. WJP83]|uniref:DnaJ family domain-containing protein n=1 Tax=Buttiauxella sp. WJP83 TaxID=2986951 RepID=UPI0022DE8773|nr:DUF1992 domain-containing protein [Buttiauxella sp. WJP83]WBM71045.1 DUF1992 domain-containing protein [Buttiauxella sp. WJP83]
MWLLDQLSESHILDAQRNGEFDSLAGSGAPLKLDDDSFIPPELRIAWRILKNAGCLPPALQQRKDAIELNDPLRTIDPEDSEYEAISKKLSLLELKLQQAGMSTDFLHGEYADKLLHKIDED